jgi:hypothetical protein
LGINIDVLYVFAQYVYCRDLQRQETSVGWHGGSPMALLECGNSDHGDLRVASWGASHLGQIATARTKTRFVDHPRDRDS